MVPNIALLVSSPSHLICKMGEDLTASCHLAVRKGIPIQSIGGQHTSEVGCANPDFQAASASGDRRGELLEIDSDPAVSPEGQSRESYFKGGPDSVGLISRDLQPSRGPSAGCVGMIPRSSRAGFSHA